MTVLPGRAAEAKKKERHVMAGSEHKITVLIVDDEERFLRSLKKILEIRNFNVITVDRGEKAIEAAKAQSVDVALLDLKMPGMDGEKTLAQLKKNHPDMGIIILTGHGSQASEVYCVEHGACTYLRKPCDIEEILTAMAKAFHKRQTGVAAER